MSLLVSFTKEDDLNATNYAKYYYDQKKLELYQKKLPHIFTHVNVSTERLPSPLNVPKDILIYRLDITFTELGCQQASCFNVLPNKKTCEKSDEARYVMLGDHTSKLCCQPACTQLSPYGPSFDLEWRKNRCVLSRTTNLYAYAIDPKRRADKSITGFTNMKRGFDVYEDEVMRPNKTYCEYFSKKYDEKNKECKKNIVNYLVSELFTGDTIVAFFDRLVKKEYVIADSEFPTEDRTDPNKTVPTTLGKDEWLRTVRKDVEFAYAPDWILGSWKERFENFKDKFKDMTFDMFLESVINIETFKSILIDTGFELGKKISKKVLTKIMEQIASSAVFKGFKKASANVPKYLLRLAFKKSIAQTIIKTATGAAVKLAARTAALASNVIGWVLAALTVIGMLLDLWDPYGLSNITDEVALLDLSSRFKSYLEEQYYSIFRGDPEDAFQVPYLYALFINQETKKDMYADIEEEASAVFFDRYYEYLFKLTSNSSGQDLNWKQMFPGNVNLNFDNVEKYNLSSLIHGWDDDFDTLYMQPRNIGNHILEILIVVSAIIVYFKNKTVSMLLLLILFIVHYFITASTVLFYEKNKSN